MDQRRVRRSSPGHAPAHRQRNLQAFSLQVLMQPWISSSTLPFAWAALRAGVEASGDSDAPLEAALTLYHRALAEELTPLVAVGTLTAMFVHTDEADRAMAARVVLTRAEYWARGPRR